jgi:cytochrome c oxidase subunit 4
VTERHGTRHGVGWYVGMGILMLAMTLAAFLLVGMHVVSASVAVPILLLLAVLQVAMQAWIFMHLDSSRRAFSLFFAFGIGVALVVSLGVMLLVQPWA